MRIPRSVMIGLCATALLTVTVTAILLWNIGPGPDVAGSWSGYGWGSVDLKHAGDSTYAGTYSSTYGQAVGRIDAAWSPRTRRYEGTWSDGTYRFGRVTFWLERDGLVHGIYSADSNCQREPGDPVRQEFQWSKGGHVGWPQVIGP